VARREVGDITGTKALLAAVVHDNMQPAVNVILQMGVPSLLAPWRRLCYPTQR
jgi:hypothetical protein